jgi:hypothetical protein
VKLKTLSLIACCVSFALQAQVTHEPSDAIKVGERSVISGTLDNTKAIKEARLYFKSNLSDTFIFVDLDKNGLVLQSNLPAPGPSMEQIDYFFAVKYQDGSFDQSDVFGAKVSGEWDEDSKKAYSDILEVQSELDPSQVTTEDFANNVTYAYQASKLLGSAGNSVSLSSVGSYSATMSSTGVAAGSGVAGIGGLSMTTIGIGAAVVVGGGAIAASSGSSGEDGADINTVIVNGEVIEGETVTDSGTPYTGIPVLNLPGLGNEDEDEEFKGEGDNGTILPPGSAVCGELIKGSGNIPATSNITINMAANDGDFHMSYFLGNSVADEVVIMHDNVQLYTTGCTASPSGPATSPTFTLPGGNTPNEIEVIVTSNCGNQTGTYWEFTLSCPTNQG